MHKLFDIAALGEAMIEFNQTHPGQPQYQQGFGGDTSNAVIAAAKAGATTTYLTRLGQDLFGDALPLVAILRGLHPDEAVAVGTAPVSTGWQLIEVPLNSPQPLDSIAALASALPNALIGAGTVLTVADMQRVHAAGGRLIVSPNFNLKVVRETVHLGIISLPCVITPSEACSTGSRCQWLNRADQPGRGQSPARRTECQHPAAARGRNRPAQHGCVAGSGSQWFRDWLGAVQVEHERGRGQG